MTTIRNGAPRPAALKLLPAAGAAALAAIMIAFAAVPALAAGDSVSVLCYHTFLDKKKMDPYCFTIGELESQLDQLRKEGFRFVSIGDVVGGRVTGAKNVLVTIDDGNRSVYEAYEKVFRPRGIRPLLGIYPNIIGRKKYALTWEQLARLASAGCDIAAHGYFHEKINKELKDKRPAVFKMEIFKSKQVLEEKLGRTVSVFIYPFGLKTEVGMAALREAGYRYAFTIRRGKIDIPVAGGGDHPLELPRYMVTRTTWNICYNRIMKNAGLKGTEVAVDSRGPLRKADRSPLVDGIDPITRLEERLGERPSPASVSLAAKGDADRSDGKGQRKKKREERAAVTGPPVIKRPDGGAQKDRPRPLRYEEILPADRGATLPATPVQRVYSAVRPDLLVLDAGGADVYEEAGPGDSGAGSPAGAAGASRFARTALRAEAGRDAAGYRADLKKQYRNVHDSSRKSYDSFLGMVRDKLGRVRTKIRQFVIGRF